MEVGECTAPCGHQASDTFRRVHRVASVSHRVARMVDIRGRNHLLNGLKLSVVPESCDVPLHDRFVFL